ncbi:PqqD family protein [Octadecabacter sp. R77987]|uniref:PqqD family protein n=1 Tax=Octadecabacter sp. R77987 TaxID=3093874 RepID=UPI0036710A51
MARFELAGPDIVDEEFDGEIVVLSLRTGQYFGLNDSGAALWVAIKAGADPHEIAGQQGADFATRLVGLDLLMPSDQSPEPAPKLDLKDRPSVEVYDDLSDLILADPIHDVDDKKGWPNLPDAV